MFLRGKWEADTFVTNYFPLMFFPVLFVGARLWWRQGFIKAEDMDFKSGLAEIEAASYDEPPPRNWVERVWSWLVCRHVPSEASLKLMLYSADVIPRSMLRHTCQVILMPPRLFFACSCIVRCLRFQFRYFNPSSTDILPIQAGFLGDTCSLSAPARRGGCLLSLSVNTGVVVFSASLTNLHG